jgi:uncharacterized transporter YbjL
MLLTAVAVAAEAAQTSDAVATALDTPAVGHAFAYAIALAAFLVIGTLLFHHRWSRRRPQE